MKNTTLVSLLLSAVFLSSCTKEYTCSCTNPGGVFKTYAIKDSKKNARDKCAAYAKQHQEMPFSENACSL